MNTADIASLLTAHYPALILKHADTYYWSPSDKTVFYNDADTTTEGVWALLHESGHALLSHSNYYSDFELVKLEMEAWEKAKEIAVQLGTETADAVKQEAFTQDMQSSDETRLLQDSAVRDGDRESQASRTRQYGECESEVYARNVHTVEVVIDEDHIQDCLDSYRNWLHKRSLCPDCNLSSIQIDAKTYSCVFCHKKWSVTAERFGRPYRKSTL